MVSRIASLLIFVLIPIAGVLWFDWDWRFILILYWFENLTVITVTLTQMARTPRLADPGQATPQVYVNGREVKATKGRVAGVFTMVFMIFTIVHGVFVFIIAQGGFGGEPPEEPLRLGPIVLTWAVATLVQLGSAILTPREELPSLSTLNQAPMKRIFVLHFTVILTAFTIMRFDWAESSAVLLIALHFILDATDWQRDRRTNTKAPTSPPKGEMGAEPR